MCTSRSEELWQSREQEVLSALLSLNIPLPAVCDRTKADTLRRKARCCLLCLHGATTHLHLLTRRREGEGGGGGGGCGLQRHAFTLGVCPCSHDESRQMFPGAGSAAAESGSPPLFEPVDASAAAAQSIPDSSSDQASLSPTVLPFIGSSPSSRDSVHPSPGSSTGGAQTSQQEAILADSSSRFLEDRDGQAGSDSGEAGSSGRETDGKEPPKMLFFWRNRQSKQTRPEPELRPLQVNTLRPLCPPPPPPPLPPFLFLLLRSKSFRNPLRNELLRPVAVPQVEVIER